MSIFSVGPFDWHLPTLLGAVPDTVWAALVSATVAVGLTMAILARRVGPSGEAASPGEDPTACHFLLNGSTLRPLSGAARALLDGIAGGQSPLPALIRHLEKDSPRIADDLEGLVLYGTEFRRTCLRPDGSSYEIVGQPRGGAAILCMRPASIEARALDEAERALARARADGDFLREALDRAPVLVWSLGPDDTVRWANAAYRSRFELPEDEIALLRHKCAFEHLLEEVPLTARPGCEDRRRVKVGGVQDSASYWFEVSRTPLASGETLCFALEADDLVAAEASLRRFVETLTETFAHLPIGLAVFDKNRRLGLFNPALSDLVKIDAVWLAGRPSLRDFLERLRETRQMPEQKDFTAFRRMLTTLEEGARDGTYEENWVLPSGKIFRVSGRPHPQGALAFLFEDISPAIHLERRYRAELELSQATLDRMTEAVAVFDTSGMLVFVNSAFERLWTLDPMENLDGPTVAELASVWADRCHPSALWADLRAFATGADARTSWTREVTMRTGRPLAVLVAPLPDGSTLVTFRNRDAASGGAPVPGSELDALAQLEGPAQAALAALGGAIAAAPDARAFGGLTEAARALKDGLARARAVRDRQSATSGGLRALLAPPPDAVATTAAADRRESALVDRLAALLGEKGISLGGDVSARAWCPASLGATVEGEPAADPSRWEPVLPDFAAAVAAVAAREAAVDVVCEALDGCPSLVVRVPAKMALPIEPEPTLLAAARRRMAALGARLDARSDGEGVVLAAQVATSPAPAATFAAG